MPVTQRGKLEDGGRETARDRGSSFPLCLTNCAKASSEPRRSSRGAVAHTANTPDDEILFLVSIGESAAQASSPIVKNKKIIVEGGETCGERAAIRLRLEPPLRAFSKRRWVTGATRVIADPREPSAPELSPLSTGRARFHRPARGLLLCNRQDP